MKKFKNKFDELYLAESSFTNNYKCRLLRKKFLINVNTQILQNRNSVFIYFTFMVNTKNL